MNQVRMGYYPTDPGNIDLILRGIRFPEGKVTEGIWCKAGIYNTLLTEFTKKRG